MKILPKSLWGDMLPYPVGQQRVRQAYEPFIGLLTNSRHNDEAEVEGVIKRPNIRVSVLIQGVIRDWLAAIVAHFVEKVVLKFGVLWCQILCQPFWNERKNWLLDSSFLSCDTKVLPKCRQPGYLIFSLRKSSTKKKVVVRFVQMTLKLFRVSMCFISTKKSLDYDLL
jgi:hypothetical protein